MGISTDRRDPFVSRSAVRGALSGVTGALVVYQKIADLHLNFNLFGDWLKTGHVV
jgi:hypothetical protein